MFRCELCQTVVPPRQRATKIVLATRPRTYAQRGREVRERFGRPPMRGRGPVPKRPEYDKGGVGTEIVREATVCPRCAAEHQAKLAAAPPPPHPVAVPEIDESMSLGE